LGGLREGAERGRGIQQQRNKGTMSKGGTMELSFYSSRVDPGPGGRRRGKSPGIRNRTLKRITVVESDWRKGFLGELKNVEGRRDKLVFSLESVKQSAKHQLNTPAELLEKKKEKIEG